MATGPVLKFELPSVKIRTLILLSLSVALTTGLVAQKRKSKKDEEPPTQVLPPEPEPPDAVSAETARLSFQVSPLSAKGLLSQQVRDALKALMRDNRGAQIVKIRAFVSGSGDLRRVQQIVGEEFTDRKIALPAVSTIQVGGLPMVGAQVVLEASSVEKRTTGAQELTFVAGADAPSGSASIEELKKAAGGLDLLRVTCFLTSLDDAGSTRTAAAAAFPGAAIDVVQTQRQPVEPVNVCEAVGRAGTQAGSAGPGANGRRRASITTPKVVFSGTKLVFRDQDSDIRLALERLSKVVEPLGADPKRDVVWMNVYPLTRQLATRIEAVQADFFKLPLAGTSLLFEGLPSTDATAAIEWVAAAR